MNGLGGIVLGLFENERMRVAWVRPGGDARAKAARMMEDGAERVMLATVYQVERRPEAQETGGKDG